MKNPFTRLFRARDKPGATDSVSSAPTFYFGSSAAGKSVTASTAIQMSTVYACVRVIAETIASAGTSGICLNDQGGLRMDVTHGRASTLRAEARHPPCVLNAFGFCTEHSADSRGIGYEDERAPTLRACVVPGVAIDFNPTDSRIRLKEDDLCQTLHRFRVRPPHRRG